MTIVRITLTSDYLVGTDEIESFIGWLDKIPLHCSHAARDSRHIGYSQQLVRYEILTSEEAYPQEAQ